MPMFLLFLGAGFLLYLFMRRSPAPTATVVGPRPEELSAAITLEEIAATERIRTRELQSSALENLMAFALEREGILAQRLSLSDALQADLTGRLAEYEYSRDVALKELGARTLNDLVAAQYGYEVEMAGQRNFEREIASRERVSLAESAAYKETRAAEALYSHQAEMAQIAAEAEAVRRATEAQREISVLDIQSGERIGMANVALGGRRLEGELALARQLGEMESSVRQQEINAAVQQASIDAGVRMRETQAQLDAIRSVQKTERRKSLLETIAGGIGSVFKAIF